MTDAEQAALYAFLIEQGMSKSLARAWTRQQVKAAKNTRVMVSQNTLAALRSIKRKEKQRQAKQPATLNPEVSG